MITVLQGLLINKEDFHVHLNFCLISQLSLGPVDCIIDVCLVRPASLVNARMMEKTLLVDKETETDRNRFKI